MFIFRDSLNIVLKDDDIDGFVVEECGQYDESLSKFCIVCREYEIQRIMYWARDYLGEQFPIFEKQFEISRSNAMKFILSATNSESYTDEFVKEFGGLDAFYDFCISETGYREPVLKPEPIVEPIKELDTEPEPVKAPEHTPEPIKEPEHTPEPSKELEPESEPSKEPESKPEQIVIPEPEVFASIVSQKKEMMCSSCIYNKDGTFKGFEDGQVLTLLNNLRELDRRIALDTLDSERVLSEEEIAHAAEFLDGIAPSVFKSFLLSLLKNTENEVERIRTSVLLDKFAGYISTVLKG